MNCYAELQRLKSRNDVLEKEVARLEEEKKRYLENRDLLLDELKLGSANTSRLEEELRGLEETLVRARKCYQAQMDAEISKQEERHKREISEMAAQHQKKLSSMDQH